MAEVQSYRDLKVWQRAMDLTVAVYELTRRFPRDEPGRMPRALIVSPEAHPSH